MRRAALLQSVFLALALLLAGAVTWDALTGHRFSWPGAVVAAICVLLLVQARRGRKA
jgi:hypothetical protein